MNYSPSFSPPTFLSYPASQTIPSKAFHSANTYHQSVVGLPVSELKPFVPEYLNECELRFLSPRTIETRKVFIRNLLWFLETRGYASCGIKELREFFHYLLHGHEEAGGRFGQKQLKHPVRPITLKDYDTCLRGFFDWLKLIGILEETPFAGIPKPRVQNSIKMPLSPDQIADLIEAAANSLNPKRNIALLSFLLDTGCRSSELVSLCVEDVDLINRCATVLGKGNKHRTVYFGEKTARALRKYLKESKPLRSLLDADDIVASTAMSHFVTGNVREPMPLFLSERGRAGEFPKPLTRSGLQQLLERLARQCGIRVSCSPHAFRRSFAVQTLRNGANAFSVQAMLGHTNLQMTQKYCAIALADVETQHRQFGPLDRMLSQSLHPQEVFP